VAQILRRPAVKAKTGLSNPTLKRLEAAGQFPARVELGKNSVGWIEHEVDEWIASRRVRRRVPIQERTEDSAA
jgi:prophage regulatory protein